MYTEEELIEFGKMYAKKILEEVILEYDKKISWLQKSLQKERDKNKCYQEMANVPTLTQNENYRKTAIRLKKERDYYKVKYFNLKAEVVKQ